MGLCWMFDIRHVFSVKQLVYVHAVHLQLQVGINMYTHFCEMASNFILY